MCLPRALFAGLRTRGLHRIRAEDVYKRGAVNAGASPFDALQARKHSLRTQATLAPAPTRNSSGFRSTCVSLFALTRGFVAHGDPIQRLHSAHTSFP